MDRWDADLRLAMLDATVTTALGDLSGLFDAVVGGDPAKAAAGLRVAVPEVVAAYGGVAGQSAADWYATVQPSTSGFAPNVATPAIARPAALTGSTAWAVTPLLSADVAAAWSMLSGVVQKAVSAFDRETVVVNAARDPHAGRWRRYARGDACAFCAYTASVLDAVDYETNARKYHDHCRCYPMPLFAEDMPLEQANGEAWARIFEDARQAILDERNATPRIRRRAPCRAKQAVPAPATQPEEHPRPSATDRTRHLQGRRARLTHRRTAGEPTHHHTPRTGRVAIPHGRTTTMSDNPQTQTVPTPAAPAPVPTAPAPQPAATPQAPAQEPTDWKAEARKWEDRAKANKDAADQLAAIEDAAKTETQKAIDRATAAEAALADVKKRDEVAAWKKQVSTDTGVPVEVLAGETLEAIQAHGEVLKPLISPTPTSAPPAPVTTIGQTPPASGNVPLKDQIAAAEASGDKALVSSLKALMLGSAT